MESDSEAPAKSGCQGEEGGTLEGGEVVHVQIFTQCCATCQKAPRVSLDPEELTTSPSLFQCPTCHEVIITKTVHRVGDTAWLACLMCSVIGGVAGCCLLPFCTNTFKDVEHKCPKCHCDIHTFSKL